ncbi:putative ubiquitin fusion degradation protein Ufd1 [Helianthus annuus]|nr:putative ubiquitin fusion degradation protein Ufd1 [Helianthus annuus]
MLFELRNSATERVSHCGVLVFIAEEGMIYMPYWMMGNLLLQEGDIVRVKNVKYEGYLLEKYVEESSQHRELDKELWYQASGGKKRGKVYGLSNVKNDFNV